MTFPLRTFHLRLLWWLLHIRHLHPEWFTEGAFAMVVVHFCSPHIFGWLSYLDVAQHYILTFRMRSQDPMPPNSKGPKEVSALPSHHGEPRPCEGAPRDLGVGSGVRSLPSCENSLTYFISHNLCTGSKSHSESNVFLPRKKDFVENKSSAVWRVRLIHF